MKIALLTSTETRHRFVTRALCARYDLVAVGYENTGYSPAAVGTDDLLPVEREIVRQHFAERGRLELAFFGDDPATSTIPGSRTLQIAPGELNSARSRDFLRKSGADVVVIYGTNLIKSHLLDDWAGRMINLHLGLSPYYRGTATNFYPLLNDEPEFVGATIHLIDPGIDSGAIYRHARPSIVSGDRPHTIGCKAILAGVDALIDVLHELQTNGLEPTPQWSTPNARLYRRKDFHPRQVVDLYRKLDAGLIDRYVARAASAANRVRLIEKPSPAQIPTKLNDRSQR